VTRPQPGIDTNATHADASVGSSQRGRDSPVTCGQIPLKLNETNNIFPDCFSGKKSRKNPECRNGKIRAGNNREISSSMQTNRLNTPGSAETVEPATTLLDEGKYLHILTELPGVHEEMIKIDVEKTTVTIAASDAGKQVRKMITFPCEVSFCMKRFSEGVLTLTLEKNGS